jgi:hypothetical protein
MLEGHIIFVHSSLVAEAGRAPWYNTYKTQSYELVWPQKKPFIGLSSKSEFFSQQNQNFRTTHHDRLVCPPEAHSSPRNGRKLLYDLILD